MTPTVIIGNRGCFNSYHAIVKTKSNYSIRKSYKQSISKVKGENLGGNSNLHPLLLNI